MKQSGPFLCPDTLIFSISSLNHMMLSGSVKLARFFYERNVAFGLDRKCSIDRSQLMFFFFNWNIDYIAVATYNHER